MFEEAEKVILQYAAGKTVAVAVSGGSDSMALLHAFLPLFRAGKLRLKAVTVDHGIRAQSKSDAAFVRSQCLACGVECRTETVDVPQLAAASGRGIEAEAHFVRRAFFERVIADGYCDLVATAHHARDNAETVLLHLFRGCGTAGLAGMKVFDGHVLRPFLSTPKAEIDAFVAKNRIPFVSDATNDDTRYDRNYLRHVVLPAIEARFCAAVPNICRTARNVSALPREGFAHSDDAVWLKEDEISADNVFAALRILGRERDVYSADIERVQALPHCKEGARATLSGGVTAAREYGRIVFFAQPPILVPQIRTVQKASFCDGALYIDADKLPENAQWRTRRDGDRFCPFGGGTKKLKEYLIDKKIPVRVRDALPLLCSDENVLVIAGVEIAEQMRVDAGSTRIWRITAESGGKRADG